MLEERQVRIGIRTAETGVLFSLILFDLFSFFDWAAASSCEDFWILPKILPRTAAAAGNLPTPCVLKFKSDQ